jgi:hypothetical protein
MRKLATALVRDMDISPAKTVRMVNGGTLFRRSSGGARDKTIADRFDDAVVGSLEPYSPQGRRREELGSYTECGEPTCPDARPCTVTNIPEWPRFIQEFARNRHLFNLVGKLPTLLYRIFKD